MITESGSSCAPAAVSSASYSSLRGPRTWPSSSCTTNAGDRPYAVLASAESARYSVPSSWQASCLAVSRISTYWLRLGDRRTVLAASANRIAACSRDCAAEYSCEFGRASGPHRCSSSRKALSAVFAFFRPNDTIARRVPDGLS